MTIRKPLVQVAGAMKELPSGDLTDSAPIAITGGIPGKPTASLVVPIGKARRAFTVAAANCSAQARTAATASLVVTLKKRTTAGTETTVGTFTWATSGTLATVSISAGSIGAGDMLLLDCGTTPDTTLADLAFLVSE